MSMSAVVRRSPTVTVAWKSQPLLPQQTRDIHPILIQCWTGVVDGGPTLSRLLRYFNDYAVVVVFSQIIWVMSRS